MCLRLKRVEAEALRVHLLERYGVGLISLGKSDLRVAFSCIEKEDVRELFDTVFKGVKDLGLFAQGSTKRCRQYLAPQPSPGKWTRVVMPADELTPYGADPKEGREKKLGKGERFSTLVFMADADASATHYVLIDNLVIRKK